MKSDLNVKYLQYLNNKKADAGFTLIELLVVIIIIGILSAIALPAFLNQANKARASEAKTNIGSINRAQQAYILESPKFVTLQANFGDLGLGIQTQTENFTYKIAAMTGGVTAKAQPTTPATDTAVLKGYVGATVVGTTAGGGTGEATTLAQLCETKDPVNATNAAAAMVDPTLVGTPPAVTGITCNAANQKAIK
ncbi:MAG: type IV pilin-like G/H family protein [Spirulinaceae cyanobacterium]